MLVSNAKDLIFLLVNSADFRKLLIIIIIASISMKSYKNTNDPQRSFVSEAIEKHSSKNQFFPKLQNLIDWQPIDEELQLMYTRGQTDRGAKAYSPLLLFKMHLISEWYQLSDTQTESFVVDSISALKFCGLAIEEDVPGHSTLSRFKKELIEQNALNELVSKVNDQLESARYKISPGKARIDARLLIQRST